MVIKKLKREIESLEERIKNDIMSNEDREELIAKRNILNKLWEFVESGSWLKKKGKEKLETYIKGGDRALESKYNMNKKQVGRCVYYLNQTLEEFIDDKMITQVLEGKGNKVIGQFKARMVGYELEEEFISELRSTISDCGGSSTRIGDLNDCEKELRFLRDYSINVFYKRLGEIDMNKLETIVNVMRGGKSEYNKQRGILYQYLIEGKGTEEKVVEIMTKIFNCEV